MGGETIQSPAFQQCGNDAFEPCCVATKMAESGQQSGAIPGRWSGMSQVRKSQAKGVKPDFSAPLKCHFKYMILLDKIEY
jgi:hypothetical protein